MTVFVQLYRVILQIEKVLLGILGPIKSDRKLYLNVEIEVRNIKDDSLKPENVVFSVPSMSHDCCSL